MSWTAAASGTKERPPRWRATRTGGRRCWESDMAAEPILSVERLVKEYRRGLLRPRATFRLEADFAVEGPAIVGVMGPNGSGKTTLFELITGGNLPTAGRVL